MYIPRSWILLKYQLDLQHLSFKKTLRTKLWTLCPSFSNYKKSVLDRIVWTLSKLLNHFALSLKTLPNFPFKIYVQTKFHKKGSPCLYYHFRYFCFFSKKHFKVTFSRNKSSTFWRKQNEEKMKHKCVNKLARQSAV